MASPLSEPTEELFAAPDEESSTQDTESQKIKDYISGVEVPATPEEIEAVQVFSRRLVEDYEYDKRLIQTRPQFHIRRTPSDEVKSVPLDITIFSDEHHTEENVYLVVECKRKTRKDGLRQLKIYMEMCPATIGVWFNGNEHAYLWKTFPKGKLEYIELPNIPKSGQRVEDIGKFRRKDLRPPQNLKAVFKDIRNHLAGLTTGITRDEALAREIMNILFCKIYDEINTGPEDMVNFRAGVDEKRDDVKARLFKVFEKVRTEFNDVFGPTDEIALDTDSLVYVVGELQNYSITEAKRDAIGEAFEVFIGPALKGGEGQFFTPRNVVKLAVAIINPTATDFIIDPACGSGGFLIVALEHVWRKIRVYAKKKHLAQDWVNSEQQKTATRYFRGIEKDSFLAKVTKAYMAIVGDGRGGVFCENSLFPTNEWRHDTQDKIRLEQFDVVFTNPPFGKDIRVKGASLLSQFKNLGYKWKRDRKTRQWLATGAPFEQLPPQIVFVERCFQLLKDGGRMAIVLPDGILGGEKLGYIANYIKKVAKVIALIDLPIETFAPMVKTKTHLLVLEKRKAGAPIEEYSIFMAVADRIGHDRKGRPTLREDGSDWDDLPIVAEEFERLAVRGDNSKPFSRLGYLVESKWLEDNLVAKRYLPEFMEALRRIEESSLKKRSLKELAKNIYSGANVASSDYTDCESGLPYILVNNITPEGINCSDLKYVRRDSVKQAKNAVVRAGDIIITRCANAGVASIVPKDLDGAVACGFVFRLVSKDKDGCDPNYLEAFLNGELGSKQTQRLALGSILQHITKPDLEGVRVLFPADIAVEKDIAAKVREATEKRVQSRALLNEAHKTVSAIFLPAKKKGPQSARAISMPSSKGK